MRIEIRSRSECELNARLQLLKNAKILLLLIWFIAGSAHAQVSSSLLITNLSRGPDGWSVGWNQSAPSTAYTVQFQDGPADRIWRIPDSLVQFPVASNLWVDSAGSNTCRLFRVVGVEAPQRGKVLASSLQRTLSTFELGILFSLAGVPITPQYSVRMYKARYETISPLGA